MAVNYPAQPGDIDHLIADDHTVVDRLFQHLEAGRGDRRVLTDQIIVELSTHTVAEEVVMYPLWRTLGMDEFDDDARQEHGDMKELLATLSKTDPGEDEFEKALSELIEVTRHHVEDEEQEEMPAFRDKVGADKLAELGKQVLAAKRQAPPAPHPHAPDEGKIERAVGALAKPVDAAKAAVTGKNKHLATDASGLLDPQAQALVDAYSELTPRPSEILEPAEARKQPALGDGLKKVMRDRGIEYPEPVDSVKDVQIPDGAGGEQTLRVFTPANAAEGTQPIILWIHGGGWVLFDEDSYDSSCRGLANKTGAIVVSPHYRLAPEYVFPAAHDDVLTAWRWTAANAAQLGGDPPPDGHWRGVRGRDHGCGHHPAVGSGRGTAAGGPGVRVPADHGGAAWGVHDQRGRRATAEAASAVLDGHVRLRGGARGGHGSKDRPVELAPGVPGLNAPHPGDHVRA